MATKIIYEKIYDKLAQVIPLEMIESAVPSGKSLVGKGQEDGGAMMDLHYNYLRKDPQGHIIALSHYYRHPSGDMIPDPDMEIRVIPSAKMVEALIYQDTYGYQHVYTEGDKVNLRAKRELNTFLNQWLSNLIEQGHKVKISEIEEEISTPAKTGAGEER